MAHEQHKSGHHGVGHIVPVRVLVATGLALLVLTVITVGASLFDFGAGNIWIALSIAVLKGSLVVLLFMHLRYDRPFNGFVFCTALAFVALFITFAMTDTFEYARDLDTGNAERVEAKLLELEE